MLKTRKSRGIFAVIVGAFLYLIGVMWVGYTVGYHDQGRYVNGWEAAWFGFFVSLGAMIGLTLIFLVLWYVVKWVFSGQQEEDE